MRQSASSAASAREQKNIRRWEIDFAQELLFLADLTDLADRRSLFFEVRRTGVFLFESLTSIGWF